MASSGIQHARFVLFDAYQLDVPALASGYMNSVAKWIPRSHLKRKSPGSSPKVNISSVIQVHLADESQTVSVECYVKLLNLALCGCGGQDCINETE